jgi:MFS family permease
MLTFVLAVGSAFSWLLFFPAIVNTSGIWFALFADALSGLSIGTLSPLTPLYMVELSPPESTDFFGTLNQVGIASGFVLCNVLVLPFSGSSHPAAQWNLLVGVGVAIALLQCGLIWQVPESPVVAAPVEQPEFDERILAPRWLWTLIMCCMLMAFQQTTGVNFLIA